MNDTTVKCTVCGETKYVKFGECLAIGWPKCHDLTMRLESTAADIDASVGKALRRSLKE